MLFSALSPIILNSGKLARNINILFPNEENGEEIIKSINKSVSRHLNLNSLIKIERGENSDTAFTEMRNGVGIIHFGIDCYIDIVRSFSSSSQILFGIMAHECWHVYQFSENHKRVPPFFELEAYLACGYYLGILKREEDFPIGGIIEYLAERNIEAISKSDHGTPQDVERCIITGFRYAIVNGPTSKKDLNAYFKSESRRS
ncbi:hypothetical protein [Azospirillum palustre]